MSSYDRKQDEVRRMLGASRPALPPGLTARAAGRGRRILRRRRRLRTAGWVLLALAVCAFCVWAALVRPWVASPAQTPPLVWDR
ncbi:hypothetical protein [Streptomyces orinoci]|uniref:Uncharacterized protein n=1 Tax=Streptomyces orinoci TaxID=67339 RepID=A0ABV3JSA2_STRON|nr:hypothetical protein [Streptomyces orinoci]